MIRIEIHTEYIQLNQLLKMLNWAESGSDANELITSGKIKVNDIVEYRKRNKIYPGMKITFDKLQAEVVNAH